MASNTAGSFNAQPAIPPPPDRNFIHRYRQLSAEAALAVNVADDMTARFVSPPVEAADAVDGVDRAIHQYRLARFVSLLRAPSRLATEVLEEWCGAPMTIEIHHREDGRLPVLMTEQGPYRSVMGGGIFRSLGELLQISTDACVQFRTVLLRAGAAAVATANAVVVLDRLSAQERTIISTTSTPLGNALAPNGLRREMITTPDLAATQRADMATVDADSPLLSIGTLLNRGGSPAALVQETFLRRILDWGDPQPTSLPEHTARRRPHA